jgi:GNAT superfamily N-acetyltransferase
MDIEIAPVPVGEVMPLRELYRQQMNCQIVHDSYPGRGFADAYVIHAGGRTAGHGLVANRHYPDTVIEFSLLPGYRAAALPIFRRLLEASRATHVRAQTNDRLLLLMLYDCATKITSDTILFADALTTHLACPTGVLRRVTEADRARLFEHRHEPVGEWAIESEGVLVATGGALFHYNPPYGDIFMEVHKPHRRRGFGSYLVQELKRLCYEQGKLPAARCGTANTASRATLQKAGLLPCARILLGEVIRAQD